MSRLLALLTALALGAGVAACGEDEETAGGTASTAAPAAETATSPAGGASGSTATSTTADPGSDEPFEVEARITAIKRVGGSDDPADQDAGFVVVSAQTTDGELRRVIVPPDVTLDQTADRALRDPACAGKVLANLELVDAPAHEKQGDSILVSARIDTADC